MLALLSLVLILSLMLFGQTIYLEVVSALLTTNKPVFRRILTAVGNLIADRSLLMLVFLALSTRVSVDNGPAPWQFLFALIFAGVAVETANRYVTSVRLYVEDDELGQRESLVFVGYQLLLFTGSVTVVLF